MALDQELARRERDLSDAQASAQQVNDLADKVAGVLGTVTGSAGTASALSRQLGAARVHDQANAQSAISLAGPTVIALEDIATNVKTVLSGWRSYCTGATEQRVSMLQQQWSTLHNRPGQAPTDFPDPLLNALVAYSSYAERSATQALDLVADAIAATNSTQHPPAGDPGFPAAIAGWVQSATAAMDRVSEVLSAADTQLSSTLPWSAVTQAAADTVTTAQYRLAVTQRLDAALTGAPPDDPAALSGLLSDLTNLRVNAWPDPVLDTERGAYQQRTAELQSALTALLGASTGAPATSPLALLPVRVETRFFSDPSGGPTQLRVRIFPDDIHVDAHDPRLTADEATYAKALHDAIRTGANAAGTWTQTAARFGPARAAYLINADPTMPTRPNHWAAPAVTSALPGHWLVIGYAADGTPLTAAMSAPVQNPLQVGPDPGATPTTGTAVDDGLRWLVDYCTALNIGMAVTLLLDGGVAGPAVASQPGSGHGAASAPQPGPPTLSRLVVVGVGASDGTSAMSKLLTAHHYTGGLEVMPYGTPTNNTPQAPSGATSADPGYTRSYRHEIGDPIAWRSSPSGALTRPPATGDAARLAAALGVDPVLLAAAGDVLAEQTDQQAMTALTWPATWGPVLGASGTNPPLSPSAGLDAARTELLRSWAVAWLRPGGPLPTLRIGMQPYGFLPVLAVPAWADSANPAAQDPAAAEVAKAVHRLLPLWVNQYTNVLAGRPDFDALLERRPNSVDVRGRLAAGKVSDWLQPNYGLLQVGSDTIAEQLRLLPGWLGEIWLDGRWPEDFLVLPDWRLPADPWPLTRPAGTIPFVAGDEPTDPGPHAYLQTILDANGTLPAPPGPATLFDTLARASWSSQPGIATSTVTLSARGNLGDQPEPLPPSAIDETHGAVRYLAGRPSADFANLLGGALDTTAYRLDAVATALATCRLGHLRASAPTGLIVGGFGFVENLAASLPVRPYPKKSSLPLEDQRNRGYLQAPSLQQATTAAVLRSGFLTHNPAGTTTTTVPFAVDLSSARARTARWLIDGIRQGQPLAALLGYRFERAVQEAAQENPALGGLIDAARQVAPYDPAMAPSGAPNDPAEAVRATDVVDGVTLLHLYQQNKLNMGVFGAVQAALDGLVDAADALADAALAQALHDTLTGSIPAAAGSLDAFATGTVPPPIPNFLDTPRTGVAITHRVLVPCPKPAAAAPPTGWPDTPRGRAEPGLTAWLADLLGDPAETTATVRLLDAAGNTIGAPVAITLSQLVLGPLDLIALAQRPAELQQLAVHTVLTGGAAPPSAVDGILLTGPAGVSRTLAAVLGIATAAGRVLAAGRAADARDLAPPGSQTDPQTDLADLATRVEGAAAALTAAAAALGAALPGDPVPGAPPVGPAPATAPSPQPLPPVPPGANLATLAAALLQAVAVGVVGAVPVGMGTSALPGLVGQARAAWAEIMRRRSAVAATAPAVTDDAPATLSARTKQLTTAFGPGFVALPLVSSTAASTVGQAVTLTDLSGADPGQAPAAWVVKAARVHPGLAALVDACCAAEALGTGPTLSLTVAQLSLVTPAAKRPWVGLPFKDSPPVANTLSLTLFSTAAPHDAPLSGLVAAEWTETVPNQTETTGIVYHYDAPGAQAPQTVLLAVPAAADATGWSYNDLLATIATTIDLTHARCLDYADLPPLARLVLPAAYLPNGPTLTATPPVPVTVPGDYLTPEDTRATIDSVQQISLRQGATGQLQVTGHNMGVTPYQAFTVLPAPGTAAGPPIAVVSGTVTADAATLQIDVDRDAATGAYQVQLGGIAPTASPITVTFRPRADTCDTPVLTQKSTAATQTVTVKGQLLANATVHLTGSSAVTWTTNATDTSVTIAVTIAGVPEPPSAVPDPRLPYIKPIRRRAVYTRVQLTLTVSPVEGEARSFGIGLDALSWE